MIQKLSGLYKEYFIYSANFLPLAAGTGAAFTPVSVRIDEDAYFEFTKTTHIATSNRFRLKYRDDTDGRFLMQGAPDARTISGTILNGAWPVGISDNGFLPFIWPRPYIISPSTSFGVEASDFSGVANTIRISFHGSKIKAGKAPWDKEYRAKVPFVYTFPETTVSGFTANRIQLAANGTTTISIVTDQDSAFRILKIVGVRTGAALITIKDGVRDRQWMDVPVHIDNLVGNSQFPNNLPSPRYVEPLGVISFTIQDLSGATNDIEINLIGEKLYE